MKTNEINKGVNKVVNYTDHALKRLDLRGISKRMVNDTLKYGELIHRQGIKFYIMLKKSIPECFESKYIERILGTTVLISYSDNAIITVYKNK